MGEGSYVILAALAARSLAAALSIALPTPDTSLLFPVGTRRPLRWRIARHVKKDRWSRSTWTCRVRVMEGHNLRLTDVGSGLLTFEQPQISLQPVSGFFYQQRQDRVTFFRTLPRPGKGKVEIEA